MRRHFTIFGLVALLAAAPALADVTVRYRLKGDEQAKVLTMAVADDGRVRSEAGSELVMITRDGVGYFIATKGNERIIARQDDFVALMVEVLGIFMAMVEEAAAAEPGAESGPGAEAAPGEAAPGPPVPGGQGLGMVRAIAGARYELREAGRETVGGREGVRYELARADGEEGPPMDMVLSDDPDLAPVGREMVRLLGVATGPIATLLGERPDLIGKFEELLARGTPIRIGDFLTLEAVSAAPIAANAFDLPGPVLSRDELRARMGSMGTPPPGPPGDAEMEEAIPLPEDAPPIPIEEDSAPEEAEPVPGE